MAAGGNAEAARRDVSPERLDALIVALTQNQFTATARQRASAAFIFAQHLTGTAATDPQNLKHALCPIFAESGARQAAFHRLFDQWAKPAASPEVLGDARALATKAIVDGIAAEAKARWKFVAAIGAVFLLIALVLTAILVYWPTVWKWLFPPVNGVILPKVVEESLGKAIDLPPEFISINERIASPLAAPLRWALTLLPLAFFGLWLANRWRKRLLWMDHSVAADVLDDAGIAIPALRNHLFADAAHHLTVRNLHSRRQFDTDRLAIRPTVAATAASAGHLTPVFERGRASSDYLFLIEQRSANDHMARLMDEAVTRLRAHHILVDRYYFRSDPRACWRDDEHRAPASLRELAHQLGQHHMVVFATADGFFHPVSGDLHRWFDTFETWPSRTLLNARPLEEWSDYELKLLEAGFSLAIASGAGLAAYAEGVNTGVVEGKGALLQGRVVVDDHEPAHRETMLRDEQRTEPEALAPFTVFRDAPDAPEIVVIPPGRFLMGSPESEDGRFDSEGPQHEVEIDRSFAIGRFPVTVEEFGRFRADIKADPPGSQRGKERDRHPVTEVSWNDARDYCRWLTRRLGQEYRLPSEAEWEYACRAGTRTAYPWGDIWQPGRANGSGQHESTTDVGHYPTNAWGLYDMIGNVWEWCADEWASNYDTKQSKKSLSSIEPKGTGRVLRGGSWYDDPRNLRSANRNNNQPDNRNNYVGFRVARTLSS